MDRNITCYHECLGEKFRLNISALENVRGVNMRGDLEKKILRLVSVLVVLNLAFGGFLGLMLIEEEGTVKAVNIPYVDDYNIVVTSNLQIDASSFPESKWEVDANLTVRNGAILTITDTIVEFQYDTEHRFWCKIQDNAQIHLINSTLTVITSDAFDIYEDVYWFNSTDDRAKFKRMIPFTIDVISGGYLNMEQGSALKYEGKLNIDGGNATIRDSVITSPSAPESTYDWGVVINIRNTPTVPTKHPVIFEDSRVEKSPWYQGVSYCDLDQWQNDNSNVTMYDEHRIDQAEVYVMNTYFDIDYQNKTTPSLHTSWDNDAQDHYPWRVNPAHNSIVISQSTVKFYGLTIDMSETNNEIPDNGYTSIEILDTISSVTLYRWLAVFPVDNTSVPVEGATVDITTWKTGPPANTINNLNSESENLYAWAYIRRLIDGTITWVGATNTMHGTTGKSGKVIFALASDMLTDTGWPNSDQLPDGYNVDATYSSPPGPDTSQGGVDFENFPRVFPEDNFVNYPMLPFDFKLPHPELYPVFITTPPPTTPEGVFINISVRVFNDIITVPGDDADDVYVQFWDGDPTKAGSIKIGERTITQILAGNSQDIWINWNATPPGFHRIYVAVDRDFIHPFNNNLIPEENEGNNMISAPITVLERPDLFINASDISFSPSDEVVNGTAVQVKATIHNLGGSSATVNVNFYEGTISGPGSAIGSKSITVSAGGSAIATVSWGPFVGTHYVYVYVDESNLVLEADETNNNATGILTVLSRPDLEPTIIFDPVSPVYEGTMVTISAVVSNAGDWNVTQTVAVRFYHTDPDIELNWMGEKLIRPDPKTGVSIEAGDQETVSIQWEAEYSPTPYTFYVRVDYIVGGGFPQVGNVTESDEADNEASAPFTVNPRPNLVVYPDEIIISDPYPMNGASVDFDITIRNTGLSDVTDPFYVRVYLDEVGGTLLQNIQVTGGITSGGSTLVNFNWPSATPPGLHDIVVYVDYDKDIDETDETDNIVSTVIIIYEVPSDLIVNNATYYPGFSPDYGIVIIEDANEASNPYTRPGFTLVEEKGVLIVTNSIFMVEETMDDEYNIVVKDQGTLKFEDGSSLTSGDLHVNIYIYDYAVVYINSSTIAGSIDIIATDYAKIYINDESAVNGDIFANDAASNVEINIVNSTLGKNMNYIGGSTFVELWGVYIVGNPASDANIIVKDNAKVYVNWYLTIYTVDINNKPIEDADVTYYRSPPWKDFASYQTTADGVVGFWLRGMNITSSEVVRDIGNYNIKAEFTSPYTTLLYYPNNNITVWMTQDKQKTIKFDSVMPELDPPLDVSYPYSVLSVGDIATVSAWVNNTGSNPAYDFWVKFDNNRSSSIETGWPVWFYKDILAPDDPWYIEFEWVPKLTGYHNISILVDATKEIIEEDEENNLAWTHEYVTPQKADLIISNIWFTYVSTGPTENGSITVHANIKNIGETIANPSGGVLVEYYQDGTIYPDDFIGYGNISVITPGQTQESSFVWTSTTPPGWTTIYVIVDRTNNVEETNDTNNTGSMDIYLKRYPDITPVGLDFYVAGSPVSSVTDTTLVTMRATVQNIGETVAKNVKVQFFEGDPDLGYSQIGSTQTISQLDANGGTGQAEVVWQAEVTGKSKEWQIYVVVSGITENFVDNNEYTNNITVTLRPDLKVVDIKFSDESPSEGQNFQIFAYINNSGGTAASNFFVGFYDGDPSNEKQIGTFKTLSVGIDETGVVDVTWLSPEAGAHEIYVIADAFDDIDEVLDNDDPNTNNIGIEVIVVYSKYDIIVNNANTPYDISAAGAQEPLVYPHRGYTLVEENGVFTLTYTTFRILETADYQYNIIVRNNGTLILESRSMILTSGPLLKIYLYDNATLQIEDSIIDSSVLEIQAYGNSKLYITESSVGSYIKAEAATANVYIEATNSSLTQPFNYFGGTSSAIFTNVYTSSVHLSDSSELTVYQWLVIHVKNGAGTGISGSTVTVIHFPAGPEIPDSPKDTDASGIALFKVKTDYIRPTSETSWLPYNVEALYPYGGIDYTGSIDVSFSSYLEDKTDNVLEKEIYLSALKPDFKVDTTSVKFYKVIGGVEYERNTVGVREEIIIKATVYNVGNATTTGVTGVIVKFYHRMEGVDYYLGEDTIDTDMPAKTGSGIASITWVPDNDEVGDNEEIWVKVDPDNLIPEIYDTLDNWAYGGINVIIPPDISVSNIYFNTEKRQNVNNATETQLVTIYGTISNLGSQPASGVNVSIFSGFPDYDGNGRPDSPIPGGVELIGGVNVASLNPGTPQTISVSWGTTGKAGGHQIYIYALDFETPVYIADQILSNNHGYKSLVINPKPDLRPIKVPPSDEYIILLNKDGTSYNRDPEISRVIVLQTTIYNDGQVYISSVNVTFYDGDPDAGGIKIGTSFITIMPNSPRNASVEWIPSEPVGSRTIYVVVNKDRLVLESDYDNNKQSTQFDVGYANVLLQFTEFVKSKYDTGGTIQVSGRLIFSDSLEGVPNIEYTIRVVNANTNQRVGSEITGTTGSDGSISREIAAPDSAGKYRVELEVDYGGIITTPSSDFEAEAEAEPLIPVWLLLVIILIVVAVIVIVGVLLGRYGLGRLVECGECGAFIPEGEKKCPKCGAVFEADTAKCSECGAWIPVTSKSCPECGAVFAGIEKEKKSYIEGMKAQYQEYVDQFRPEAKDELGDGMTDEAFIEWWKASPKYVGFEEWLEREEEVRKGRTKNCPTCNTVNPESAAICFKCGTVFKEEEEELPLEEEMPPEVPPAEVPPKAVEVTREAPRGAPPTVVPKKVARPPEVVPKKVVKAPPTVVPKKVVRPPEEGRPTVVPKKVVRRPPEEEEK